METSEKKKTVKSRRFRLRVGPSTRLVLIAALGAAVPTACLLVLASRPAAAALCIPIAVAAGLAAVVLSWLGASRANREKKERDRRIAEWVEDIGRADTQALELTIKMLNDIGVSSTEATPSSLVVSSRSIPVTAIRVRAGRPSG